MDCAFFNDTSFMSTQIVVLFVAYWHAFDIAWPKQKPTKDCSSYKGAHVIIEDSVEVKAFIFEICYCLVHQLEFTKQGFQKFY